MSFREVLSFDDVLISPEHSTIAHRADINLSTSVSTVPLEIPIVSANMSSVSGVDMVVQISKLGGLGLLHRMYRDHIAMSEDLKECITQKTCGSGAIGFSFGVGDDWEKWVAEGINSGADIGCLDVAHADCERVLRIIPKLSSMGFPFIIGNIATIGASYRLINQWVTHGGHYSLKYLTLKVGIGGGSLCTTRIMTGCGLPTLQSVIDICGKGADIIADGGIRSSGDIVKSIGAGASAVMLGNLLAGTSETPGDVIAFGKDKALYKSYRGSASFGDKKIRGEKTINIEGAETLVHYKGSVAPIVESLLDGIRSGCSYTGSMSVGELKGAANFVKITSNGLRESHPYGV